MAALGPFSIATSSTSSSSTTKLAAESPPFNPRIGIGLMGGGNGNGNGNGSGGVSVSSGGGNSVGSISSTVGSISSTGSMTNYPPQYNPLPQLQLQLQHPQQQQHLHLTPPHSRTPSLGGGGGLGGDSSAARSRSCSPFTSSNNSIHQHHHNPHHPHHHTMTQIEMYNNNNNTNNNTNTNSTINTATTTTTTSSSTATNASSHTPVAHSNAVAKYTFQYLGHTLEIRNVWKENVEEEMAVIRQLIERYPYVAMDTEFPGIVAKPVTDTYSPDYHYKSLKINVDLLKIIQLGLSFADEKGNFAPGCPCWQFNFLFDLDGDMFAQDSIDLLQKSGISFDDHAKRGIDPILFGELLMVSGLVLDDRVKWVSFHSGYDYGYLLKLLTTVELPADEKSFFELLRIYFPIIYDIKFMTSLLDGHQFMGGLQKLADDLSCQRLGAEHQAGSDSLLTMATYFALTKAKFTASDTGLVDDAKFANELFGYGTNHTVRKGRDISVASSSSSGVVSE